MNASARRGQPIAALLLVLASWAGARALLWETPFAKAQLPLVAQASPTAPLPHAGPIAAPLGRGGALVKPVAQSLAQDPGLALVAPPAPVAAPPVLAPVQPVVPVFAPARIAGGQQMLWMAAMAQLPMPALLSSPVPTPPWPSRPPARPGQSRWSADGWLAWRNGGTGYNLPGSGLPGARLPVGTYGASQYGAVLRYRLDPGSGLRPTVYLRGTGSVDRPRYQELAAGLAARPIAAIPVAAMAEVRATRSFGETRVRPAIALVSELAPFKLPLGARGEAYVQAGYVGGKGATAFADGQLRIDRAVASPGGFDLRAGAGAWGGAQKGARRVDVGPTASLGLSTGAAAARLSADWRFRVAGRAAPGSGPAITLSAGF